MATGTVKWFNLTKGFGFISPDAGGPEVFVHISAVEKAGLQALSDGQRIEYELISERGKFSAANLAPESQKQPSINSVRMHSVFRLESLLIFQAT